ncbi:MAG: ferrous iron transport protein B [Firmicutes bacterium]|nr:ferrous iron transport protein B [Bacillota bacterium]
MGEIISLKEMQPGQKARIKEILSSGSMRRRLLDIGLIKGTKIECVGKSPAGDPLAFYIRGAVIAIREEDCRNIIVEADDCRKKTVGTERKTVALAGNPNVGKSTVFNGLTGMRQHTGNWPGKTVTSARGTCRTKENEIQLVDIPGTYSLIAKSKEEEVARDYLLSGEPQAAIVVCDATCLERNLNLAIQIMEICPKVILCVNLMDEAKKRGISIDLPLISERLGIPVVGITARRKSTLNVLTDAVDTVLDEDPKETLKRKNTENLGFDERREILEDVGLSEQEKEDRIVTSLVTAAERVCRGAVKAKSRQDSRDRKLDRIFTGKIWGYPVMLIMLALILWITIVGANYPSELLADGFAKLQIKLTALFAAAGAPVWLHDMLVLGVYRVLSWVVSVMLPPMAIFFPLFTILEDAGYLPRIAYNMDKTFKRCGACGKQALTTCMGFGCNAVGVMGCRIIDSPRERLLAILTNNFVPCNGRFSALIAIITMFFAADVGAADGLGQSAAAAAILTLLIAGGIAAALVVTWLLSKTFLKGMSSSFTLELPPYRCPQFGKVIVRSIFDRTIFVLARAIAAAAPAGLIVWIFANTVIGDISILNRMVDFMDPAGRLMGMDGAILTAFILGLPANEIVIPITIMIYTAQGSLADLGSLAEMQSLFAANGWTWVTALCTMIFYLLHWPCATTLLTIRKETGSTKWTLMASLIPTVLGFAVCSIISLILK